LKKQLHAKKKLKLRREALCKLSESVLQNVVGGTGSIDSCFPDICQDKDSSAC
jgi:hypothetical protein